MLTRKRAAVLNRSGIGSTSADEIGSSSRNLAPVEGRGACSASAEVLLASRSGEDRGFLTFVAEVGGKDRGRSSGTVPSAAGGLGDSVSENVTRSPVKGMVRMGAQRPQDEQHSQSIGLEVNRPSLRAVECTTGVYTEVSTNSCSGSFDSQLQFKASDTGKELVTGVVHSTSLRHRGHSSCSLGNTVADSCVYDVGQLRVSHSTTSANYLHDKMCHDSIGIKTVVGTDNECGYSHRATGNTGSLFVDQHRESMDSRHRSPVADASMHVRPGTSKDSCSLDNRQTVLISSKSQQSIPNQPIEQSSHVNADMSDIVRQLSPAIGAAFVAATESTNETCVVLRGGSEQPLLQVSASFVKELIHQLSAQGDLNSGSAFKPIVRPQALSSAANGGQQDLYNSKDCMAAEISQQERAIVTASAASRSSSIDSLAHELGSGHLISHRHENMQPSRPVSDFSVGERGGK